MPKGRKKRRAEPVVAPALDYNPFEGLGDVDPAVVGAVEEFERLTREFWSRFGERMAESVRREALGG